MTNCKYPNIDKVGEGALLLPETQVEGRKDKGTRVQMITSIRSGPLRGNSVIASSGQINLKVDLDESEDGQ